MESKTKLLDQMRHVLRLKHMSIRTEKAYVQWAKRFILFHHSPSCPSPATRPVRALRRGPAACRLHPVLASR